MTSDKNTSTPRFELASNDETLAETGPSAQKTKHLHRIRSTLEILGVGKMLKSCSRRIRQTTLNP